TERSMTGRFLLSPSARRSISLKTFGRRRRKSIPGKRGDASKLASERNPFSIANFSRNWEDQSHEHLHEATYRDPPKRDLSRDPSLQLRSGGAVCLHIQAGHELYGKDHPSHLRFRRMKSPVSGFDENLREALRRFPLVREVSRIEFFLAVPVSARRNRRTSLGVKLPSTSSRLHRSGSANRFFRWGRDRFHGRRFPTVEISEIGIDRRLFRVFQIDVPSSVIEKSQVIL